MRKYFSGLLALSLITSCGGEKKDVAVRLTTLTGQELSLNEYRGKVVFVNIWATWCAPCLREMPTIEKAGQLLAEEPIVFFFASNEDEQTIREFAAEHSGGPAFVRLLNMEELGIQALPATVIFDAQGEVAYFESGFRKWDDSEHMDLLMKLIEEI